MQLIPCSECERMVEVYGFALRPELVLCERCAPETDDDYDWGDDDFDDDDDDKI